MTEVVLQKPVIDSLAAKLDEFDDELSPSEHEYLIALVGLASARVSGAAGVPFDVEDADVVGFGGVLMSTSSAASSGQPWIKGHIGGTIGGPKPNKGIDWGIDVGWNTKPMTTGTSGSGTQN